MKNNHISANLKSLIHEKSDICVTMIIPLHEIPTFRKMDALVVDHAISKLRALMQPVYDAETVNEFISKISYLKDDIRRINGVKGIGIFMSDKTFHTETFPFDVKEKIQVGPSFEVRDVLYRELRLQPYHVLSLSAREVKLFRGRGNGLKEVVDDNFPASVREPDLAVLEHTVANASRNGRRHRSEILESTKSFQNALDKKLLEYIGPDDLLFLAGVEKELASFESATIHRDKIRGKVTGSYVQYNLDELESKCGELLEQVQGDAEKEMIMALAELFGREIVSVGISSVWRSAHAGKGNVLLVERDLAMPGFVGEDEFQLWLSPPNEKHRIVSDAVDEVIECVMEKNGRVMFVDNGKLSEFQGIALINRY